MLFAVVIRLPSSHSVWEYDPLFHTDSPAGNVSGTWTLANSPHHVLGEIAIPNGETLTIEPGVEIVFKGTYEYSDAIEVDVRTLDEFVLEQNFPNPINPITTIGYVLKEKTTAKLIYLMQSVKRLLF